MDEQTTRWLIEPCPEPEAVALAERLDVSRTTAEVLLRRGLRDEQQARAFLEADGPRHDPLELGEMAAACDRIVAAIEADEQICVHGDYDADGICATALAVLVLRTLGAKVGWHLPSRFEEGYGVGAQALERLASEGVRLVLTVDCGITAVSEVRRARELGMDVIVTDHHRPGPELPDCTRVCTRPSDYPFPELCGTGVVLKLAEALYARLGRDRSELDQHLDLVALATVADVVPLVDENRGLVRAGLRRMARTAKPGLRALMSAGRIDRARVGSTDLGFRLGPRINAAGRLGHPAVALELLLTEDDERARELAHKLESLNRRRQAVEEEILALAVEQVEARDEAWRARRAYVLASPDWHEGVIGIVASRLVERFGRPVVLIAIGDEGAKGSGRSIPGYDLHAGLAACAELLEKFGGHRAAAGLSIDPARIERFAEMLAAHAGTALDERDLQRAVRVDAVVAPSELSLELADELARLEPFGLGNPGVTLLSPGVSLDGIETMSEGKHLRMAVELGGYRCRAVGFGMGRDAVALREPGRHDVAFRLQRNEWNGSVTPQMVLREVSRLQDQEQAPSEPHPEASTAGGELIDARGSGVQISTIARLLASGEDVLVVVADRQRRQAALSGVLQPHRLGESGIALRDWAQLPQAADGFAELVVLDPPVDAAQAAIIDRLAADARVHMVWGAAEVAFALSVAESNEPLRPALAAVWRAARDGVTPLLAPETIALCLRVLDELGLDPAAPPDGKVDLQVSTTYRAACERCTAAAAFLEALEPGRPAVAERAVATAV
ncbi:MAG: single-stranded-DNA-specific exonuclease [Gaiellales bacterium]|jgi:single-stranded-DNA-specific exonuclease|nr:single-stranded-DNA-specific exonuclease [Gaiellales bacterium]